MSLANDQVFIFTISNAVLNSLWQMDSSEGVRKVLNGERPSDSKKK